MKNKAIYLLLMFCIGIFGGGAINIAAQKSEQVLLSSGGKSIKQSDIDAMIGFYEWAFETKFTTAQRIEFQNLKIEEFRNNSAEAKKGNDGVLANFSAIRAKDSASQANIREAFVPDFTSSLRGSEDAEAKLLLSIYDAAQGGDSSSSAAIGDVSSLAGKWVWSSSSSSGEFSRGGSYLGSNGSRFTYSFAANGAVEYTGIMNVMNGGCSQQVFMSRKGRASVSGNYLAIKWINSTSTRDFSCDKANNYTKTLPAETENMKISFKTNSTGQRLFCTGTGKDEMCFSPLN